MVKQKKCGELKKKAMLAKQRMKMGYWERLKQQRERALYDAELNGTNLQLVEDLHHAKLVRDANIVANSKQARFDEQLYTKVCNILDEDDNITNPIGKLVDRQIYDILDNTGKQRYILELSKKFQELRERYYKERLGKYC